MSKICVYTCITGNYDNLIEIKKLEKNVDYICFTNNKYLTSKTWNIKLVNENMDNLTLARKVKILSYKYLAEYDISIWIDGAINIEKTINQFIKEKCDFNKFDMIAFKHQSRDCIYDEINECVRLNKETIENATRLEKFLQTNNYPRHNGLIESTVLVRKNITSVNKLMDEWFDMLIKYSRRDQLSFNYCLWKNQIRINFLDLYVFDNEYFKHQGHNQVNKTNKYRIIFDDNSKFNYKNVVDSYFKINDGEVLIKQKCKKDTNVFVLELFDEIGSAISNIEINIKSDYIVYNTYDLGDSIYFYDKPIILVKGRLKKDNDIIMKFKLQRNSSRDLVDIISNKNNIILELMDKENEYISKIQKQKEDIRNYSNKYEKLKQEHEELKQEHESLLNSKGWRLISRVRSVKDKIYNKK